MRMASSASGSAADPKENFERQREQSEQSVPASTTNPLYLCDTLEHILSYLDVLSLSRAELVCRRWKEVIVYRRLWEKLYKRKLQKMNSSVKRACFKLELHPFHPQTSMHWRRCADMPMCEEVLRSVLIGDVVFVSPETTHEVCKYDTRSNKWSFIPPCPMMCFGIGQLSGKLITMGGRDERAYFSDVYTYEEETQQWEKSIPPMPTPRQWPSVVTYRSSVAACGGEIAGIHEGDEDYIDTDAVEVFKGEDAQWYIAAPLPIPCSLTQRLTINDTCYLGSRPIMCASLARLFQSATPHNNQPSPDAQQQAVWATLPSLPYEHFPSAVTSIGGILLALGQDSHGINTHIQAYNPKLASWERVGSLPQGINYALAAELLPSGDEIWLTGSDISVPFALQTQVVYIGTPEL